MIANHWVTIIRTSEWVLVGEVSNNLLILDARLCSVMKVSRFFSCILQLWHIMVSTMEIVSKQSCNQRKLLFCVPFCKEVLKVTCSKLSQISEMASAVTISGYPWTRAHILLRHWSFTSWLFGNILIHCIIFEEAWLFSANIRRGRSMLHSSSRSFKGLMMVAAAPSAFYRPFHWKLHGLLLALITKTVPPQVGEVYQYYLMLRLLSEMHYHFCDCQWQYLRGSHPVAEE